MSVWQESYLAVVKEPMDLGTMKTKVRGNPCFPSPNPIALASIEPPYLGDRLCARLSILR